jgi:uncharacterized protein (TIGR02646 family)
MRFIDKTNRLTRFDSYILTKKPRNWADVNSGEKLLLHQYLLAQQKHLCIYCQQSIPQKTSKNIPPSVIHPSHIEHIRPKSTFSALELEQNNLSVSCNGFEIDAAATLNPDFCGHKKDKLGRPIFV